MSPDPTTSKSEQVGPFIPLQIGDLISFDLFPDVPPQTVRLRRGVLVSIEVQIADTASGDITVQTPLGLVSVDAYEAGKKEPEELVPLEAIKSLQVDRAYRTIANWQQVMPALGGTRGSSPLSLERIEEDGSSEPYTIQKLRKQMAGKSGGKHKKAEVKGVGPSPYLSTRR